MTEETGSRDLLGVRVAKDIAHDIKAVRSHDLTGAAMYPEQAFSTQEQGSPDKKTKLIRTSRRLKKRIFSC